jgi:hypothetical protein
MPGPPFFNPLAFTSEIVFTLIAVVFCILIYLKTKESYELTKHEGLRYFRDAFLFFGLSYALRFIFSIFLFSNVAFDFLQRPERPSPMLILPFIILLGYFSTVAIFYLLYSSVWKTFNHRYMLGIGHAIAIILSILAFATRSEAILLSLQTILLVLAIAMSMTASIGSKKKRLSSMKALYILISILWLINLWVIDRRRPLPLEIEIGSQVFCIVLFILVYHRISKWIK